MRRRLLFAMLVLGTSAPAVLACTGVLGLHELPLREASDAAPEVTAPPSPSDDGGDCDARGPTFCAKLCPPPAFCDDFEGEDPAFSRWSGALGFPPRFIVGDGSVTLDTDERNGQVVFAEAISATTDPGLSLLTHQLQAPKGQTPRGVSIHVDAKLAALAFADPEAGLRDRYFYFFMFGDAARNENVALVLFRRDDGSLDLYLQQREISSRGKQLDLVKLIHIDASALLQNWFGFELVAAPGALLRAQKLPCTVVDPNGDPVADASDVDGAPPDGLLLLARLSGASRCVPLRDELASGDWLGRLTLVAGATIAPFASGGSRLDNVAVTYLW